MKLGNKLDIYQIKNLIKNGYIKRNKHSGENLYILNYTMKCQIEDYWTKETMQCRGLIVDKKFNIQYNCLKKFFNINQVEETKLKNLPNDIPEVYEKLDGSYGCLFFNKNGNICVSTRGSFVSEQAKFATRWIQDKGYKKSDFKEGYTYLFEILFPQNRIVVDYGDREDLVLLSVINIEDGSEIDYIEEAKRLGFNYAEKHEFKSIDNLMKMLEDKSGTEQEGFVLRYPNGLRVKIKGMDYLRLHKLVTNCSSKVIWEILKEGGSIDELLECVPDEFFDWVIETHDKLLNKYNSLYNNTKSVYDYVLKIKTRKEQAECLMKNHKGIMHLVFGLLDERIIDEMIWKMLKPKYETYIQDN